MDLSSPGGGGAASVNDGINPDEFVLYYIIVDQIIRLVSRLEKGPSWLNLMSNYLLGVKWPNQYYVDLALPFGLRTAGYVYGVELQYKTGLNSDIFFIINKTTRTTVLKKIQG